jgi:hypothetical protein
VSEINPLAFSDAKASVLPNQHAKQMKPALQASSFKG